MLVILLSLNFGSHMPEWLGTDAFSALLLFGLVIWVVWSVVAYRRGERVFIWQKING